jgi:hypothetical protein
MRSTLKFIVLKMHRKSPMDAMLISAPAHTFLLSESPLAHTFLLSESPEKSLPVIASPRSRSRRRLRSNAPCQLEPEKQQEILLQDQPLDRLSLVVLLL